MSKYSLSEFELKNGNDINQITKPELLNLIEGFKELGHRTVESALCASLAAPEASERWFKDYYGLKYGFVILNLVINARMDKLTEYAKEQVPDYACGLILEEDVS